MPRSIRQEYAGAVYHVMCRGNNGQSIFEPARPAGCSESPAVIGKKGDGQRLFLSALEEACEQTGWRVHAYVLMSNHYHLLIETPEANLVALDMTEEAFLRLKFNSPEKQVAAWLLKRHTTVTAVWLAERLQMGVRSNVSRALTAVTRGADAKSMELKEKMTQCTG